MSYSLHLRIHLFLFLRISLSVIQMVIQHTVLITLILIQIHRIALKTGRPRRLRGVRLRRVRVLTLVLEIIYRNPLDLADSLVLIEIIIQVISLVLI